MPRDRFGREIDYLRISVIDHCNLRCVYCMPMRGLTFVPAPDLLTAAEIETVARAAVSIGFRKFRLTGGEPTLRTDIVDIVGRIAAIPGVQDVAMTSNAVLLPQLAGPLKAAAPRARSRSGLPPRIVNNPSAAAPISRRSGGATRCSRNGRTRRAMRSTTISTARR